MHQQEEYNKLLRGILDQAQSMVKCLPDTVRPEGRDILDFLDRSGCQGYPGENLGKFYIGMKLDGSSVPHDHHETVVIIPTFSDDTPPIPVPTNKIRPGCFFGREHLVVLLCVERWSPADLALILLHESRHARHSLGPKLAGLSPLESDDSHETNTWLFTVNVLNAWGKDPWEAAVRREIEWLEKMAPGHSQVPGFIARGQSGVYWPELDVVFGPPPHDWARQVRQSQVVLCANMRYWSAQNPTMSAEQICHSLVSKSYS